jgi:glycolate oxidase iron-sulfur subunit
MQHAQQLHEPPRRLLREAGFDVVEIPEGHLCCGSAGTYNMLQPALARRLGERKLDNIGRTGAAVVAAGNLGCLTQLATRTGTTGRGPAFVHTVELLDWATGGPAPDALSEIGTTADRGR